MKKLHGLAGSLALGVFALSITGCRTHNQQDKGTPLWKQGKVTEAAAAFTKKANSQADTKDTIIWRLGQGTALRTAGQVKESQVAFEQAEAKISTYEERAKVRLGNEAGAMLSNQDNLPYEGRDYDKVMLSTYKALNYIQLGDFEKARPELIRAFQRQQDAVENNKKQIEKAEEKIKKAAGDKTVAEGEKAADDKTVTEGEKAADDKTVTEGEKAADDKTVTEEPKLAAAEPGTVEEKTAKAESSADKARQDPKVSSALSTNYFELDTLKAYADYVNPFPVYLDGIYFLNFSAGGSDLERARKSFERVRGLSGDNKYIKADLEAADTALRGEPVPPTTYIIFETGCAPWRGQIRIDIPLFFIGSGNVPYVGAAFPRLKFDDNYVSSLTVSADGTDDTTITVASMDSVVGQSFKNELPTIITKTLVSTTIKAGIAYGINKAVSDQNAIAGIFAKVITGLGQAAMNIADLRTWTTLPKEFQICRIPTPTNQVITLSTPASAQKVEVKVEPNSVNLIYVKAINATNTLIVNQVKFK
jgi:hypothetical protein